MTNTPAGWYDDGQGGQRWWDGSQWTEHTQPGPGQAPAAPQAPQPPGHDMPTQVAPNRAADYGQQQPQQPGYGAPGQGQQPGYGAPQQGYGGQQAYGAQGGGYGAPQQFGAPPSGGGKGKALWIGLGAGLVALILLCAIGAFVWPGFLTGGGGPKGVAEDYLAASADGDFEEVCELSSKKNQKTLFEGTSADKCSEVPEAFDELFSEGGGPSFEEIFDDLDVDYEVGDATEDGDKATVEYTVEVRYTGDDEELGQFFEQEKSEEELTLVKEDGEWKVDGDSSGMTG